MSDIEQQKRDVMLRREGAFEALCALGYRLTQEQIHDMANRMFPMPKVTRPRQLHMVRSDTVYRYVLDPEYQCSTELRLECEVVSGEWTPSELRVNSCTSDELRALADLRDNPTITE